MAFPHKTCLFCPAGAGLNRYHSAVSSFSRAWQSKLVLLLVFPAVVADLILQVHWWLANLPNVALWSLGLATLLAVAARFSGSASTGGALAGFALTAEMIFSTSMPPYQPWHTALLPVLTLLLLTSLATRLGRRTKDLRGLSEAHGGRNQAQVAANLGVAALAMFEFSQSAMMHSGFVPITFRVPAVLFLPGLAALAEAAADTVSSEVGQILGGEPRLLTSFARVPHGTDGAISPVGTLAGAAASAIVTLTGFFAFGLGFDRTLFAVCAGAGVAGFLIDSLLGATLERSGWLDNDLVNFLSTLSAAALALGGLTLLR